MSLEKNHRLSVKGFALTNPLYVESFPHPHSLYAQIDEFRETENVACAPLADPLVYMGFGFVPDKFADPVLNSTNHISASWGTNSFCTCAWLYKKSSVATSRFSRAVSDATTASARTSCRQTLLTFWDNFPGCDALLAPQTIENRERLLEGKPDKIHRAQYTKHAVGTLERFHSVEPLGLRIRR
jgi:hypothetical protein